MVVRLVAFFKLNEIGQRYLSFAYHPGDKECFALTNFLQNSYKILDQIRLPNGLYMASPSRQYSYVWLRDCLYMSLPYLNKSTTHYERAMHKILDLLLDHEWKIDYAIDEKPKHNYEYLHSRYHPYTLSEIHDEEWGHVQHDSIGAILFGIGLGITYDKKIIRNRHDERIIQKLVYYLESCEYWSDPDCGIWEEWKEVHASSVGACVAGLKSIASIVDVPDTMIQKGMKTLYELFPRESHDKRADLAQLSLIYPYDVFGLMGEYLVVNVEKHLLRSHGVIRYEGDSYYSTLEDRFGRHHPRQFYYGTEAEWTFGLPWLALCYHQLGNFEKAVYYLRRSEEAMLEGGILPELYYAHTKKPNPNTPLGWSQAMYILAKEAIHPNH